MNTAKRYFVTTETPHQWSSGPDLLLYDLVNNEYIASLDRAKEIAMEMRKGRWGEKVYTRTSYGELKYTPELDA